jgi:hypothetical protein
MSKKKKNEGENHSGDGKAKKGFESTYQADKLRECIKAGLNARSIMEKLGVKSKQVLKQHVLKLIQEDKVFYEILGLYEKGGTTIRATPKGELKIGPSVLKAQGADVSPGDEFHLSVDGDIIILSKVKKDATSASTDNPDSPLVDESKTSYGEHDTPPDETQA